MSAEVANKCLTLTGHPGMFSQAGLTGSAWGLFRPTTPPRHCDEVSVKNPRVAEIKHDKSFAPTQFNLKYTPGGRRPT
eukprot:2563530-Amphidinium_carterae.1